MGNRAIIKGKNQALGVYVHWNGGYDLVNAFCIYCKLKDTEVLKLIVTELLDSHK